MKMTNQLSPSKVGTGSSVFRPALAGRAAQESTKRNQIKQGRRRGPRTLRAKDAPDRGVLRGGPRAPLPGAQAPTSRAGVSGRRPHRRREPSARFSEGGGGKAQPRRAPRPRYPQAGPSGRETQDRGRGGRGPARGTRGTSDLTKALAGRAQRRGPAGATWSRESSRAPRSGHGPRLP